jgi:hypothetical protein
MIDDGLAAGAVGRRIAGAAHDITGLVFSSQPGKQCPQLVPLRRIEHVIGVEPEGKITRGMGQGLIPRQQPEASLAWWRVTSTAKRRQRDQTLCD